MNERARLQRILDELDLPGNRWLLGGSSVMILHDIERSKLMGDVDIFVATRLWFELHAQTMRVGTSGAAKPRWSVFTTDPDDELRRCDPPYLWREVCGLEVNVFSAWRLRGPGDFNTGEWIASAEMVAGRPCLSLEKLLAWKVEMGRAKDLDDIRAIREHLGVVA